MGKDNQRVICKNVEQGVLLLDRYNDSAEMLKNSFRMAGFAGPVIVIQSDGFLPDDVISLYRWFCSSDDNELLPGAVSRTRNLVESEIQAYRVSHAGYNSGKARFFNQIEVPDYWEISSNASAGQIHDLQHLRGRIFYSSRLGKRLVSDVDWLNEEEIVRCTDHYDCQGQLYARTVFNKKGERFLCSWFDEYGRERVTHNFVTDDIIVNRNQTVQFFENVTQMAVAMLKEIGANGSRIYYNSLSTPMFVTENLERPQNGNVLFWQEEPRMEIPGNMKMIFSGKTNTSMVCVQNRSSYHNLDNLGAPELMLRPLGFIYDFQRENEGRTDALICTNSDQIEGLAQLVERFGNIHFHIAAVTEMSSKLLAFGRYENVFLYPTVKANVVDELFQKCDIYLDINHGGEILSAGKRAFLNNQCIMALKNTVHNSCYVTSDHIYKDVKELAEHIAQIIKNPGAIKEAVEHQREAAMSETVETYRKIFTSK